MDELELVQNIPILVEPTMRFATIQNTMPTNDDDLYVSSHGDILKKWINVESGDSVRFCEPTYFMQTGRFNWVFPVVESDGA